ncbi:MAG: copper chaperone [Proteobacteria bacterium]|nr:MAG: copper chaperone [Pseudomonadota bacterium]TDJ70372.1 MAG: copper chaperone [Pseudomonadota bacterium]
MRVGLKILTLIAGIAGIHLLMIQSGAAGDKEIILSVPGIPGPYCAYGVEKRLLELDGIVRVELHWKDETIRAVIAEGRTVTAEQIRTAVKLADYPYAYSIIAP